MPRVVRLIFIPAEIADAPELKEIFPDLETLTSLVGGYLEPIELDNPRATLIVDEEGRLKGRRFNQRATALVQRHCPSLGDFLVGDVVLLGPPDSDGNETDVPQEYIDQIKPV